MKNTGMLLVLLFVSSFAFAQKQALVERVYEGASGDKNPVQAKRQILDEATEKTSEALIKEIIGEGKYGRNKALITQKILRNSARYIPFSKPGELKAQTPADGFKMTVSLKISLDDLQAMLLENGLFYDSDGTPSVMPMIHWEDKVRMQSYSWWKDQDQASKAFLSKQNKSLENQLRNSFLKSQFYSLKPAAHKFQQILLPTFSADRWSVDDLQNISRKMGVQILVDGDVTFSRSQERSEAVVIQLKMSATQIQNGRAIAEVSRQMESDPGPFEIMVDKKLKDLLEQASGDLATQVFEAWSRGTIGSSLYKLTLRGRLGLMNQEAFKEVFRSKLHEVKNIRERLITPDSLVFELDSLLGPVDIAKKLTEFEVAGQKIVLESSNESEITYKLIKGR